MLQGWRLDPLLLFGQLMTTGAAVSFGIEALRLRSEVYEQEEKAALQDVFRRKGPGGKGGGGASFQLPPPEYEGEGGPPREWSARRPWEGGPPAEQDPYYGYGEQSPGEPVGAFDSAAQAYAYGQGQGGPADAYDGAGASGQYVEADYYDAAAGGYDAGYSDQPYGSEGYPGEEDPSAYRGPSEFEVPPGDADPPPPGPGGPGRTQYGGGEDWD